MGHSKGMDKARKQGLFPTIAAVAADLTKSRRAAAHLETMEILLDVEQVTDLLASLDDMRHGRIVSMNSAFEDL